MIAEILSVRLRGVHTDACRTADTLNTRVEQVLDSHHYTTETVPGVRTTYTAQQATVAARRARSGKGWRRC